MENMEVKSFENQNKEISDYIKLFRKKFVSFRSRSPVFFNFQVDLFNVYIQKEDSLERYEFPIDYQKDVTKFIHEIHMFLRENIYPRLVKTIKSFVDPPIEEINSLVNQGWSFDNAFKKLSVNKTKEKFIIDKIDKNKNRIVLIQDGQEDNPRLYKMDYPVVVFILKITKEKLNSEEAYEEFREHSEYIEKKE